MDKIDYFETKLYKDGLIAEGEAVFIHAETASDRNTSRPASRTLSPLFSRLGVKTILMAPPAEPYRTAFDFLAKNAGGRIYPQDSETRMFLHDLPVTPDFNTDNLAELLQDRKCVIIPQEGILACGDSPKQAYVNYSAACFAGLVKFFSDSLSTAKSGSMDSILIGALETIRKHLFAPPLTGSPLARGPFETENQVLTAIIEAGKAVVSRRLVDSCFGNISYRLRDKLYISQSGSFLDTLDHAIAVCPISDPVCAEKNPSSEYPAHKRIADETEQRAILHGHPVFSVIVSMDCNVTQCDHKGRCHRDCPYYREVCGVPIVPGETGAGPYGLCETVPEMLKAHDGVIVYGHGVFTSGGTDFNEALDRMIDIERKCRQYYLDLLHQKVHQLV